MGKKEMSNKLNIIIGTVLLILLGAGGLYVLYKAFWVIFSLPKEVLVPIIVGVFTVFGSVFTVVYSKSNERKAEINKDLRLKKIPIYEELIDFLFKVIYSGKEDREKMLEKEMVEFFEKITKQLTIWGSDEIIKSYSKFRNSIIKQAEMPENKEVGVVSIFLFEELLFSIRNDLGYKNKDFKKGDILSLFINDLDDHL